MFEKQGLMIEDNVEISLIENFLHFLEYFCHVVLVPFATFLMIEEDTYSQPVPILLHKSLEQGLYFVFQCFVLLMNFDQLRASTHL